MLLLAVAGLGVPVASSAQEDDRAALIALYTATGEANWTTTTNWNSSAPRGKWHGVTTAGDGRVTRRSLEDNNLTGAIPPALGTLTHLGNQEDLTDEQYEALSHALGMSVEEIRALGLSPDELQVLLDGFTEETVVVGSRGQPRTVAASPVPVDVLSTADLTNQGVVNLQDQLRTVIPSFNVNTQPISDASTVVRPAMLRNLAPDHTLVLVNGKRRHRSSIIDWHGGNGVAYGSQGPDISAIPAIALRQVEVLRDGAAAQYGSDAIAGVLNFQLRDAASGGSLEFDTGTFGEGDGEAFNVAGNVGLPLGATGFANLSLEYGSSNPTNRSAPRSDAIALLAAGNTHVMSDTPQIWGSPEVDDDLKLFGNFGYTWATGVQAYAHTNYASKRVTGGFFFRNPNTRGGVFSPDGGGTLLVGDRVWAETGTPGAGNCPTVPIAGNVPDGGALAAVAANPSCFTLYERFPGGFTPSFGGEAQDMSVVGGVRGFTDAGFNWDASVSVGAHETDLFIRDTVNASLGYDTPTAFELGSNRQREIGVNFDVSYAATDMVNIAAGAEWRDEQYQTTAGDPTSWTVGPYGRGQGFSAGSNGFFGYGPLAAGTWSRSNVAAYGDVEVNDVDGDWTLGGALRVEHFEDFGTTTNGKVSARYAFVRASVSSGFRAPTPGQQNGFNISTVFDPAIGDLVNNGVIPSISPVAALRGGVPLEPEQSINYTAGVVFDTGPFNFSADYFLINVSDRIGITSNFSLDDTEIDGLLAQGIDSARDLRNFRFFTNAFSTRSQGLDVVSTYTPIALRGNTVFSAVFNFTDTEVTDNEKGLLGDRRLAEYAYALPRLRWNAGVNQRLGRVQVLGRVSYFGGWYDWDSGFNQVFLPRGGIEQGFFDGRPIVDVEASIDLYDGTTLAFGAQNLLDTYPQESARAMSVGEKYSEYTPWGFNGAYYYARIRYAWGQ